MGFTLMDNFKNPYFSKSFTEFWQRWHISLSTWFQRLCLYSIGGNKVSWKFWLLNILIVFALSGFWHGASWTFVIWGLLHGIVYISEKAISKFKNKIVIQSLMAAHSKIRSGWYWHFGQYPYGYYFGPELPNQVNAIIHALLSPTQNGDNIFIEKQSMDLTARLDVCSCYWKTVLTGGVPNSSRCEMVCLCRADFFLF